MPRWRHPKAKPGGLVVGYVERLPCVGRIKDFHFWNESTVLTIETQDEAGATRGGIVFGISRDDRGDGVAVCSTIEETRALIKLLENGIADAERIERGETPHAREGREPPVHH